ncbi:uncharacterized protein LOC119601998, partial [Lucilia sericata]|uniref:uncharacterized protein LOC119601998 n=1 Tax=Lucilia sericata TaxID=13632 RepID=UPI0018A85AA3
MDTFTIDMDLKQDTTIDVLKILKAHHISKLFNDLSVGDQAKFENCLEKWKETSTPFFKRDEIQLSSDSSQKSSFVSVKEILSNTFNGKEILKFYSKNDILHEEQRNLLISTVAKYIEANGIPYTISDCADIENQICNIFPSEQLDFYSNGKRGKIYNKLSNLKRLSKDIFKEKSSPEEDKTFEPEENVAVTLQYLRLPTITADEFDLYWRKCARYRLKQISESKSTAEIFQMWPEYKKPSGSNLINIDFELKFPFAKQFSERWLCYKDKVIYLLQSKISNLIFKKKMQQIHTFNEESVVLTVLWNIHHLFPPTQKVTSDMSGAKIRKKFSVLDSQESFAILAESEEEIEIKLKLLMLQGRNIQPKLLISGNLEDIKSIFVYFDGNKYPFLTIVKAFDLLFKIFFVFNLQFPEESEIFYNFIQDFFYDMPTIFQNKIRNSFLYCDKYSVFITELLTFNAAFTSWPIKSTVLALISNESYAVNETVTTIALNNAYLAFANLTQSNITAHTTIAATYSTPTLLLSPSTTFPTATSSSTISSNVTQQRQSTRSNAFEVPIWLILCYSVILLCAIVGNLLVISTLVQNRRMRTITNVFLLNLAISDILLGVLCMPVTLVGTLLRHFIFGEFFCKLIQFSQAASVAVSSWTLVAISCERYYAICHPLRSRRWQTRSHAYKIIVCIWCGSMLCMLPIAMFSQLMPTSRQGKC